MATANVKCTCATCGQEFIIRVKKRNTREAAEFERWASESICECSRCRSKRFAEDNAAPASEAAGRRYTFYTDRRSYKDLRKHILVKGNAESYRLNEWEDGLLKRIRHHVGGGCCRPAQSGEVERGRKIMNIRDKDFFDIVSSVDSATDRDEFVSEWALSGIWGDAPDADVPRERVEWLGTLYDVLTMPPKQLLTVTGRSARRTAMHWGIKARTAEDWASGKNKMLPQIRLTLAAEAGLLQWQQR